MPTLHVTKAIIFPFVVKNVAGQVDTTTAATPGSTNPAALKTVINPSNPREAAVVGLSLTNVNMNNPIEGATITAFGHTSQTNVSMAAAPDQSSVTIGTLGAEVDPPDWAV